ncbi:MAG TPA: hypothetical protein PLB59_08820 [Bacteroidales bacterium]|nr:hypothetical protein [Bacteroidales bacterium]HQP16058.1 hypothetical protein [Bacteroidales bacterium]
MEQQLFKYPYYRANQFLTSQDLNESLSYVEEQERLTRIKMIGSGILSGLNFDNVLNAGDTLTEVTIKSGFGITADGYSVAFPQDVAYKYMVAYSDFTSKEDAVNPELSFFKSFQGIRYLLFTTEEIASKKFIFNPDIVKPIQILKSDYEQCCLAVAVEQKTETSYNCNPSDCNINSSYKNIVYRPVLVDISKLEKINSFYSPLDYLHIHKLTHISEIKSAEACQKKIQTLVESNVKRIEEYLDETASQVAGLLPRENVLLKKALKTFRKSTSGDVSIYYLAYLNDLQTAINEFVNVHNNFVHKYAFSSAARKDLLLVLGRIPQAANDLYRYTFTGTAAGESFVADNKILSAMYRRIAALLEYFMPAKELTALLSYLAKSSFKYSRLFREKITYEKIKIAPIKDVSKCIKIIPCKGYSEKTGCRSIPYYYNILDNSHALDLPELWHAHDLDPALDLVYNYYWCDLSVPENYEQEFMLNLENYPFYRIEGHLGLSITDVYDYLKSLIDDLDIPVQLVKVDVTNHAWNKFRDDFEAFAGKYKEFLVAVKEDIKKNYADNLELARVEKNLEKFKRQLTQTSYRNIGGATKLLDDINAYCNLLISGDFDLQKKKKEKAKGADFIKNHLQTFGIFEKRNALAGLYKSPEPITEISLSEIKGLEYLAGVYKGGTFILLHDGQKVIADFSLPYFYCLDKDRML